MEEQVDSLTEENEALMARLQEARLELDELRAHATPRDGLRPAGGAKGAKLWQQKVDELLQQHQEDKEQQSMHHSTKAQKLQAQVSELQAKCNSAREETLRVRSEVAALQKECQQKAAMVVELQTHCSELRAMLDNHSRINRATIEQLEIELEAERMLRAPSQTLDLEQTAKFTFDDDFKFGNPLSSSMGLDADLRCLADDELPVVVVRSLADEEPMVDVVGGATMDLPAELRQSGVDGDDSVAASACNPGFPAPAAVAVSVHSPLQKFVLPKAPPGAGNEWATQCAKMQDLLSRARTQLQQGVSKMQPMVQT